jgi:hypothetical protein
MLLKMLVQKRIHRTLQTQLNPQSGEIHIKLNQTNKENELIFASGALEFRNVIMHSNAQKLLEDVPLNLVLEFDRLCLGKTGNEQKSWEVISHHDTKVRGKIHFSTEILNAVLGNILKEERSVNRYKLEIVEDKIRIHAAAVRSMGGVAVDVTTQIALLPNAIQLEVMDTNIRGWGFGKLKTKGVKERVSQLMTKSSLSFPIDSISHGVIIQECLINKDGITVDFGQEDKSCSDGSCTI